MIVFPNRRCNSRERLDVRSSCISQLIGLAPPPHRSAYTVPASCHRVPASTAVYGAIVPVAMPALRALRPRESLSDSFTTLEAKFAVSKTKITAARWAWPLSPRTQLGLALRARLGK